jgi:predicted HTH transcriptional regulator
MPSCNVWGMNTIANSAELCARIEALIQEHMAASQKAVMETLQRAFSSTSALPSRPGRTRSPVPYRSKETLEALQDAIYQRLKTNPGVGAVELSAQLGIDSKALSGPIAKLKKAGLVRSVGLRAATRYFPISENVVSGP